MRQEPALSPESYKWMNLLLQKGIVKPQNEGLLVSMLSRTDRLAGGQQTQELMEMRSRTMAGETLASEEKKLDMSVEEEGEKGEDRRRRREE